MSAPHDRPDAAELIEAVVEMLDRRVADRGSAASRADDRLAAHALGIVLREIRTASELEARHRGRLADLGVADDAELAAAIRSGELDREWADVMRSVRAVVSDKLSVSSPGYDSIPVAPTND